jgi:hypothetical protein
VQRSLLLVWHRSVHSDQEGPHRTLLLILIPKFWSYLLGKNVEIRDICSARTITISNESFLYLTKSLTLIFAVFGF